MIIFKKFPYYFSSFLQILWMIENPLVIFDIIRRKKSLLKLRNGVKLYASQPLDLLILKETMVDDAYELRSMSEPRHIIDIGGALGDSALWAYSLYPRCKIDVFEPNPESHELLMENISLNKAQEKIHLYKYAVGTKKEYTFYISVYNVRSSIVKDEYSVKKIKVKGAPLEKYLTSEIDLLKIDTEGSELEVLESIYPKSFIKIKKIILEYHNHLVPHQDKKIIKFLEKYSYSLSQINDPYNENIGYIIGVLNHSDKK